MQLLPKVPLENVHMGQLENAEVWKPKYGSGSTEVRRKAAYQCLVHY